MYRFLVKTILKAMATADRKTREAGKPNCTYKRNDLGAIVVSGIPAVVLFLWIVMLFDFEYESEFVLSASVISSLIISGLLYYYRKNGTEAEIQKEVDALSDEDFVKYRRKYVIIVVLLYMQWLILVAAAIIFQDKGWRIN